MDDIAQIIEALKSLSPDKRRIVKEMINALGGEIQSNTSSVQAVQADGNESSSLSICEGMHALLKLGVAKGGNGIPISPSETLECLDRVVKEGEPVCLGTNSQAVSAKYRNILKRLYILVENRVQRIVDVDTVLDEEDFIKLKDSQEVSICPDKMEHARTWFLVKNVWVVTTSPEPKDIKLLNTGKSIAGAISAGQATFFYVQPINNIVCKLIEPEN